VKIYNLKTKLIENENICSLLFMGTEIKKADGRDYWV